MGASAQMINRAITISKRLFIKLKNGAKIVINIVGSSLQKPSKNHTTIHNVHSITFSTFLMFSSILATFGGTTLSRDIIS